MPCYPYGFLRETLNPCQPGETRDGVYCRRDSFPLFQNSSDTCLSGQCVDGCPNQETLVSYFAANCNSEPERCGKYITALINNGFVVQATTIFDTITNFDVITNVTRNALVLHPEVAVVWGNRECIKEGAPLWACGCYLNPSFYVTYSNLGFTRECSPPCMAANVPSVVKCDKQICSVDMNRITGNGSDFNIKNSCPSCAGCSCLFFGNSIEAFNSKNITINACGGQSDCFVNTGDGAVQIDCSSYAVKSDSSDSSTSLIVTIGNAINRFFFTAVTFNFAQQTLIICASIILIFVIMFVCAKIISTLL